MLSTAFILGLVAAACAGPATDSYKDQYCTDPRTMQQHAAYTEWADAYSCSRHRCQPGGRALAIYTVGCKRVEAPESAIECEEVVEDTNMQFPFCCTRLRCLVVVRGEVWTRVLGQPWETLPAAPWSHMYKMKKPPPPTGALQSKNFNQGPIYELAADSDAEGQKVLRASKQTTEASDCTEAHKPVPVPDIVIALATESDNKEHNTRPRHKIRKSSTILNSISDDEISDKEQHNEVDFEDAVILTEKVPEASYEKTNRYPGTRKSSVKTRQEAAWTHIPQKEWNEQDPPTDEDQVLKEPSHQAELSDDEKGRPALQALVDAIGTRMRDIENVVQRMSAKVRRAEPEEGDAGPEKRMTSDAEVVPPRTLSQSPPPERENGALGLKRPGPDADHYKRFSAGNRGSKYVHGAPAATSAAPLLAADARLDGYFSDASNGLLRRAGAPKEPSETYMAPIEPHGKTPPQTDVSDEAKKHRKHSHKKGKSHKKHHGKDKRKRFNRLNSVEINKNAVSLEDSSAVVNS